MKFKVQYDFTKFQPKWDDSFISVFGKTNEGLILEHPNSAFAAFTTWNANRLPGERLNPFYLRFSEIKE